MAKLTTKYLGLELRNPLVIGSSGLTASADSILKLAQNGAGAVVLKSIYEEEIQMEYHTTFNNQLGEMDNNLEFFDYFDYHLKDEKVKQTTDLINEVKSKSDIPIIASINCRSEGEWFAYAAKLETAGADALELNLFRLPVSVTEDAATITNRYLKIIKKVQEHISIPLSVKISPYFTDLPFVLSKMEREGVKGFVLFNRFYNPDFDLNTRRVVSSQIYSSPNDYVWPLRWSSILSKQLKADIAASTGVHTPETFIKMLVAGASVTQVVSAIYMNGPTFILDFLHHLEKWMDSNSLHSISDVQKFGNSLLPNNPEMFERVQFMKYFGEHKK